LQAAQRVNLLAVIAYLEESADALAELFERYAEQRPDLAPHASSTVDRLREILSKEPDPGIARVARRLGMSSRTLQRALASEGARYLEMAREARRVEAEQRLLRGEPMSEIAYALGFNDVPAFHHAFQRWTGATPGEFRARGPSPSDLRCSPSSSSTCARRTSRSACGGSRIFSFLVGNGGVASRVAESGSWRPTRIGKFARGGVHLQEIRAILVASRAVLA
jgi:AraC-like DNA-binding protein